MVIVSQLLVSEGGRLQSFGKWEQIVFGVANQAVFQINPSMYVSTETLPLMAMMPAYQNVTIISVSSSSISDDGASSTEMSRSWKFEFISRLNSVFARVGSNSAVAKPVKCDESSMNFSMLAVC